MSSSVWFALFIEHSHCRRWLVVTEKAQGVGDERLVVLEDPAVSRSRVDLEFRVGNSSCDVGGQTAVDHEVVVAVGHQDRLLDFRQVVGGAESDRSDRSQLRDAGLNRYGLVAVLRTFLEASEIVGGGELAFRGAGEGEEVSGITQRESGFD